MSKKVYVGKDGEYPNEWEEVNWATVRVTEGFVLHHPESGEYLLLRRELPKPKEEACPELLPGDVVKLNGMSDWGYMVMELNVGCSSAGNATHRLLRLGGDKSGFLAFGTVIDVCHFTELYRHGRKIWWKGKLEGQEA